MCNFKSKTSNFLVFVALIIFERTKGIFKYDNMEIQYSRILPACQQIARLREFWKKGGQGLHDHESSYFFVRCVIHLVRSAQLV